MKLSEMSTQKAAQVMCDIAVPVANIAQDEKLAEAFRAIAKSDLNSMSRIAQYGLMGSKLLPLLLKDHLDDVCQVIGTIKGVSAEEIKAQNIVKTVGDIKELLDSDLVRFFKSAGTAEPGK